MATTNESTAAAMVGVAMRTFDGAVSRMVQGMMSAPASLAAEVDRYRSVRAKTIAALDELTEEQAAWSPKRGVWSINQIADHLLRSEELYREQFVRLMELGRTGSGTTINISLREVDASFAMIPREIVPIFEIPFRIMNMFVPAIVRETIIKYPVIPALNPKVSDPRPGVTLASMRVGMAGGVEETAKIFAGPLPKNFAELRLSHPIMGNNGFVDILRILTAHEERHLTQMAERRAHPNFPKY